MGGDLSYLLPSLLCVIVAPAPEGGPGHGNHNNLIGGLLSMLAKITSCALVGLEGAPVEVEVDVSRGQVLFTIVGLPDAAVRESSERVRSAMKNSGFSFPLHL